MNSLDSSINCWSLALEINFWNELMRGVGSIYRRRKRFLPFSVRFRILYNGRLRLISTGERENMEKEPAVSPLMRPSNRSCGYQLTDEDLLDVHGMTYGYLLDEVCCLESTQAAHQAFERILYVSKTENMSIGRMCASFKMIQRDLLSTEWCRSNFVLSYSS